MYETCPNGLLVLANTVDACKTTDGLVSAYSAQQAAIAAAAIVSVSYYCNKASIYYPSTSSTGQILLLVGGVPCSALEADSDMVFIIDYNNGTKIINETRRFSVNLYTGKSYVNGIAVGIYPKGSMFPHGSNGMR